MATGGSSFPGKFCDYFLTVSRFGRARSLPDVGRFASKAEQSPPHIEHNQVSCATPVVCSCPRRCSALRRAISGVCPNSSSSLALSPPATEAIRQLVEFIEAGQLRQMLGVTGSGKTFSIACASSQIQRPTGAGANKTLAAQLPASSRRFFPNNALNNRFHRAILPARSHVPSSDTFIEEDASINDRIEQMRPSAT